MLHIDYDIVRFVGSWPGSCTPVMHAGSLIPSTGGGVPKMAPAQRRSAALVEKFRVSIFQIF